MKRKTGDLLVLIILAISITMIAYSITGVHAEGVPTIQTDKADYAPSETVIVTGSNFVPGQLYAIPVIRPDDTIVTGDGSFTQGWDNITADENGAFTYNYMLDGITGTYEARVYPSTWTGDLEEIPFATTTFTDTKPFTATIAPTSAYAGETKTYTINITNLTHGSNIGSATVSIPTGFTSVSITSWTPPAGKTWNATVVSGQIKLAAVANGESDKLGENESILVSFSAKAPSTAAAYVWTTTAYSNNNWTGGTFDLQGTQPTVTVTLVSITITSSTTGANFVKVDTVAITTPQTFSWVVGDSHTLQALSPVSGGTGIQYVWASWSDTGDQTHDITVSTTTTTYTATYQTQLKVHYASNVAVTVPVDEWVLSGHAATGTFTSPQYNGAGDTKYVFVSDDRPLTITAPTTITATYDAYYNVHYAANVAVTVPVDEWVLSGHAATGAFTTPQFNVAGDTKYVYVNDNRPLTITAPTTITATYDTYYNVHYAAGVPVTVPVNEWVISGGSATGVFPSPVISGGTKYVFVSDDRPLTITAPTTITATYDTFYWVTYAANVPVSLPASEWVKSGNAATGVFSSPQYNLAGDTKYVFVSDDRPLTITAPTTITATYDTYYWVQYAANVPVTVPVDEWVLSGGSATGVFPSPVISGGTKYVFLSDDRPVTITAPTTITATYDTFYWVTYAANVAVTVPVDEWVLSGHAATGSFASPQYNLAGDTKYVFVSDDRPLTITAPTTITATYDTYFNVHYAAGVPVTVPGDEWILSGQAATGVFPSPVISGGTKYVFVSDDRPLTITAPTTITATYDTYYWVQYAANVPVTVPVDEWVLSGHAATGVFSSPQYNLAGDTRYVFVSDDRPLTITAPATVTATYQTQFKVHYAANVAVTVPADEWVIDGHAATGTFTTPQFNVAGDTKYVFVSDDRPLTITAPTTITATYDTYFNVHYAAGVPVSVPADEWVISGGSATGVFPSPVISGGTKYVFVSDDRPLTITAPTTITATYDTQYKLTVSTFPDWLSPKPTVTLVSGYDAGSGWYDAGSVVSIDPNSPAGYTFDHWSGDASGSTVPLSVTMTSAKTIVAVYTFNLAVETGFKPGDSPSFASDPYLDDILCVLQKVTTTSYKLIGTSPGTYDYAISIKNTGTTTFTSIIITVKGNADHYLKSSNPIRVLDTNGNDITSQFTITSGTWPTVTIISKSSFQGLGSSASLYVTIHLDYTKKGSTVSTTQFYNKGYTFKTEVSGSSGPNSGENDAYGSVVFLSKKMTVIYGFVKTSSGTPIEDATIDLYKGNTYLNTVHTDADGFYCFINGVEDDNNNIVNLSGGTIYTLKCTLPDSTVLPTKQVTAQTSNAVQMLFTKP